MSDSTTTTTETETETQTQTLQFPRRLRAPYRDPGSPWMTTHDGGDTEEFIAWAEALRESEAPVGALEIALVDLIVVAARRLARVMRDLEADAFRDRALIREQTACERSWSKALGEWRRHRASEYSKDKAKAKDEAASQDAQREANRAAMERARAEFEATFAETAALLGVSEESLREQIDAPPPSSPAPDAKAAQGRPSGPFHEQVRMIRTGGHDPAESAEARGLGEPAERVTWP